MGLTHAKKETEHISKNDQIIPLKIPLMSHSFAPGDMFIHYDEHWQFLIHHPAAINSYESTTGVSFCDWKKLCSHFPVRVLFIKHYSAQCCLSFKRIKLYNPDLFFRRERNKQAWGWAPQTGFHFLKITEDKSQTAFWFISTSFKCFSRYQALFLLQV